MVRPDFSMARLPFDSRFARLVLKALSPETIKA
jgi:hypothetical protein